jgi:hypothetical protein
VFFSLSFGMEDGIWLRVDEEDETELLPEKSKDGLAGTGRLFVQSWRRRHACMVCAWWRNLGQREGNVYTVCRWLLEGRVSRRGIPEDGMGFCEGTST